MSTQPVDGVSVPPPRLLDHLRHVAREHFGQDGLGERFADWTLRLILFHDKRHPRDLTADDVGRFLSHVAHTEKDPLACLDQAHAAFTFLYHDVLHSDAPAPQHPRLPDGLSPRQGREARNPRRKDRPQTADWRMK